MSAPKKDSDHKARLVPGHRRQLPDQRPRRGGRLFLDDVGVGR
jgi:hypothetical protein